MIICPEPTFNLWILPDLFLSLKGRPPRGGGRVFTSDLFIFLCFATSQIFINLFPHIPPSFFFLHFVQVCICQIVNNFCFFYWKSRTFYFFYWKSKQFYFCFRITLPPPHWIFNERPLFQIFTFHSCVVRWKCTMLIWHNQPV